MQAKHIYVVAIYFHKSNLARQGKRIREENKRIK